MGYRLLRGWFPGGAYFGRCPGETMLQLVWRRGKHRPTSMISAFLSIEYIIVHPVPRHRHPMVIRPGSVDGFLGLLEGCFHTPNKNQSARRSRSVQYLGAAHSRNHAAVAPAVHAKTLSSGTLITPCSQPRVRRQANLFNRQLATCYRLEHAALSRNRSPHCPRRFPRNQNPHNNHC